MAKHVFAALAVAVAAVVILTVLGITKGQSVYAQAPSSAFFVSAAPGNAASTAWIVDVGHHKVIFCRQSAANASGEQSLQFGCKAQEMP